MASYALTEVGRKRREVADYFFETEGIHEQREFKKRLKATPLFKEMPSRAIASFVGQYLYRVKKLPRQPSIENPASKERKTEILERKEFVSKCVAEGDDTAEKIFKRIMSDNPPSFQRLAVASQSQVIYLYLNELKRSSEPSQEIENVHVVQGNSHKTKAVQETPELSFDPEKTITLFTVLLTNMREALAQRAWYRKETLRLNLENVKLKTQAEEISMAHAMVGGKEMQLQRLRIEVTNLDTELAKYRAHVCPAVLEIKEEVDVDTEEMKRLRIDLGIAVAERKAFGAG